MLKFQKDIKPNGIQGFFPRRNASLWSAYTVQFFFFLVVVLLNNHLLHNCFFEESKTCSVYANRRYSGVEIVAAVAGLVAIQFLVRKLIFISY